MMPSFGRSSLVGLLLVGSILVEAPPPNISMVSVPSRVRHVGWLHALQQDTSPGAVLCLPMARGDSEAALEIEARWMLLGTWHGRPMLNGYSGFFPKSWFEHRQRFADGTIDAMDIAYLQSLGVRYLMLDSQQPTCPKLHAELGPTLQPNQTTVGGIELWELVIP